MKCYGPKFLYKWSTLERAIRTVYAQQHWPLSFQFHPSGSRDIRIVVIVLSEDISLADAISQPLDRDFLLIAFLGSCFVQFSHTVVMIEVVYFSINKEGGKMYL